MENQAEVLKIQELLKKRFPKLNSEEIEKNANQLVELGTFIVRLQVKKHTAVPASKDGEGFSHPTDKPP